VVGDMTGPTFAPFQTSFHLWLQPLRTKFSPGQFDIDKWLKLCQPIWVLTRPPDIYRIPVKPPDTLAAGVSSTFMEKIGKPLAHKGASITATLRLVASTLNPEPGAFN